MLHTFCDCILSIYILFSVSVSVMTKECRKVWVEEKYNNKKKIYGEVYRIFWGYDGKLVPSHSTQHAWNVCMWKYKTIFLGGQD